MSQYVEAIIQVVRRRGEQCSALQRGGGRVSAGQMEWMGGGQVVDDGQYGEGQHSVYERQNEVDAAGTEQRAEEARRQSGQSCLLWRRIDEMRHGPTLLVHTVRGMIEGDKHG